MNSDPESGVGVRSPESDVSVVTLTTLVKRKGDQGDEKEKTGSSWNDNCGYDYTVNFTVTGAKNYSGYCFW